MIDLEYDWERSWLDYFIIIILFFYSIFPNNIHHPGKYFIMAIEYTLILYGPTVMKKDNDKNKLTPYGATIN